MTPMTDDQQQQLRRYLALVLEANQRMNLTAIRDEDAAWERMVVDSLTALDGMPDAQTPGGRVIDIGTGAGFPGVPLAVCRPDLHVTLVDSTAKKARFVEEATAAIGLTNVTVIAERIETLGRDKQHRAVYDVAICRAVGPLPVVLEYMLPLVKVGGRALAMKGPSVEEELDRCGDALHKLGGGDLAVFDAYPPEAGNELVIVSVVKDRMTPAAYPRSPGTPKASPL
jgi:16S rRNA (guanine527-N7)-methyltransferase